MTQFAVNSQRFDPYKNFKFRLWDGERTYTGDQLTGLVPPEVVKHRAGGDPSTSHKSPGRNKYESITLERGVTQDPNFGAWAGSVQEQGKYPSIPLERGVAQDSGFNNWAGSSAGQGKYPSIPLERGVTHGSGFADWAGSFSEGNKFPNIPLKRGFVQNQSFSNWASEVWNYASSLGAETSSGNLRKNLLVELRYEVGQPVVSYTVNQHGVLETPALPPRKVVHHVLHLHGHGSIPEQLAAIFENSLRKLRP